MAMTERQGGTDVRANTTRAAPGGPDGAWRLDGHKWFCSAPQSDAFLVLAQAGDGLTCFLLPRILADGARNAIHVQRLKDKVGNRSNASSEVEFHGALAWPVGPVGRGVASIMEMVRHTRLDCALGSAATLRRAVAEATHHAAHREVFGTRLADQPLMQNVLADLCLESEAATALAMRLARAFDGAAAGDPAERSFARVATAVAKYWITKRAVAAVAEALECTGGNGFVEESPLARLYRDVPVNAIWEGSGNVQCLDVLRALAREPEAAPALLAEIRAGAPGEARLGALADELAAAMPSAVSDEGSARALVERIAVGLQASLLVRHARRRSRAPSAPRASPGAAAACSARCRGAATSRRSWSARRRGPAPEPAPSAALERHVIAPRRPGVDLPWTGDLQLGVGDHLLPVRDPARAAGDREHHREHLARDAERAVDDARNRSRRSGRACG
jgi:putative acyl-CoA dehydrogenase